VTEIVCRRVRWPRLPKMRSTLFSEGRNGSWRSRACRWWAPASASGSTCCSRYRSVPRVQ
jgi:hypothetical protein